MEGSILSAILAVFSGVAAWFVEIIPVVVSIFYAEGALTFMGYLAVIALSISVVFLLVGVISNFLHFRG